jgi:hypothetical protein
VLAQQDGVRKRAVARAFNKLYTSFSSANEAHCQGPRALEYPSLLPQTPDPCGQTSTIQGTHLPITSPKPVLLLRQNTPRHIFRLMSYSG